MTKKDYIKNIADLTVEEITKGIRAEIVSFEELQNTGEFVRDKQRQVKKLLKTHKEEDEKYSNANTKSELEGFINEYPNSERAVAAKERIVQIKRDEEDEKYSKANTKQELEYFISEYPHAERAVAAKERIAQIVRDAEEARRMIREDIKKNNHNYTPYQITEILTSFELDELCKDFPFDSQFLKNHNDPPLNFGNIPEHRDDLPKDFTDVFFWGIPSAGKTCALSAIFRTLNKKYTIADTSVDGRFGATYRMSLENIFNKDGLGYLPAATASDRTQYIPFKLKERTESDKKYRNISLFELSGELFRYFYEKVYGGSTITGGMDDNAPKGFETLELLLGSDNQKIHFFFIDYNRETGDSRDQMNLTQENYLNAAATYFKDSDIFKRKTDAVYVVVTKADMIPGDNKKEVAIEFLEENFGNFMNVLEGDSKRNSFYLGKTLFSIGDVYFKRIGHLNYKYSENIINELLKRVDPPSDNRLKKYLRK